MKKITTINDVAREAGVAASTVSRVIANSPRISKETSDRVLKIMKDMHYHPNLIARSLVNKSTKIIGLVVPGATEKAFGHPFMSEMVRGIISVAHKKGYKILVSSADNYNEEKELIDDLSKGGVVEGIILTASRTNDPSITELKKQKFPFVLIGRPASDELINWVDNNNMSVSYELTKHFIDQGHRDIAFLGLSPDVVVTVDRYEGYKKAMEESGIPVKTENTAESKFLDAPGYDMMKELFDRKQKPSAVICCDDYIAFGAMKFLSEQGLTVPEDMAIAGFNNTPLAEHFIPSLTSVDINAVTLGSSAFEMLYDTINKNIKGFNRTIIPSEIIIRKSSIKEQLKITSD